MLIPMARKLLKILARSPETPPTEDLMKALRCSKRSLMLLLDDLETRGYLVWQPADDDIYSIQLTHTGEQYHSFEWVKTKEFLLRSVLVPIVVSLATSLLTLWLTGGL